MNMTKIFEHDRKMTTNVNLFNMTKNLNKNCQNDEHERLNMTKNNYIFDFWSNSIVFGQVQQVNVPHCHFLAMFKQIRLVGFVIFKPIFGQIDSVKLTNL